MNRLIRHFKCISSINLLQRCMMHMCFRLSPAILRLLHAVGDEDVRPRVTEKRSNRPEGWPREEKGGHDTSLIEEPGTALVVQSLY